MRFIWPADVISPDEPLWRYFRVERFVESLQSGMLYFAAATQFVDPFD